MIVGGASARFFRDTAARIAELLPSGRHTVLEEQENAAPAEVVGPVVAEFLGAPLHQAMSPAVI